LASLILERGGFGGGGVMELLLKVSGLPKDLL
jgi:hypothetical protein